MLYFVKSLIIREKETILVESSCMCSFMQYIFWVPSMGKALWEVPRWIIHRPILSCLQGVEDLYINIFNKMYKVHKQDMDCYGSLEEPIYHFQVGIFLIAS